MHFIISKDFNYDSLPFDWMYFFRVPPLQNYVTMKQNF